MNKFILISIVNAIIISVLFYYINNTISNKQSITLDDENKKKNKQSLVVFILCCIGTYLGFYIYDNKLLDSISNNNVEIKVGEPGF